MLSWWGQRSRVTKLGLLAFLLAVLGVGISLFLILSAESRVSVPLSTGRELHFSVHSNLPGYEINSDTLNQRSLQGMLNILAYGDTWSNFYNPDAGEFIDLQHLQFAFEDISLLSQEEQQQLFDASVRGEQIVSGSSTNYNPNNGKLTYTTYYDMSFLDDLSSEEIQYTLEGRVIRALYLTTEHNVQTTDPDAFINFATIVHEFMNNENLRLFRLKISDAILGYLSEPLANLVNLEIVTPTFAQGGSCDNNYTCINKRYGTNCTCTGSGASCPIHGNECVGGGTCQCNEICNAANGTQSFFCSGTSDASCISSGNHCSGDSYCSTPASNDCRFTADASTGNCPAGQYWCGECVQQCILDNQNCSDLIDQQCSGNTGGGTTGCPTGTYWCGSCIWSCIPNSQNCQDRIANECNYTPPPSGDPDPEYYGCVDGGCNPNQSWTSLAACEAAASNCQPNSCPSCGGGGASACLPGGFCAFQQFDSLSECLASQANGDVYGCQTGTCPAECQPVTNAGSRFFFMYEDQDRNGVWNPTTELRVTGNSSCARDTNSNWLEYPFGSNVHTLASQTNIGLAPEEVRFYYNQYGINDPAAGYEETRYTPGRCNIRNEEHGTTCTQINDFTCFKKLDGCGDGKLCEGRPTEGYPAGFCGTSATHNNVTNLREGPIYEANGRQGVHVFELKLPTGWTISPETLTIWDNDNTIGTYSMEQNGRIRVYFTIDGHTTQTYSCSGYGAIGLVRNYRKQCAVSTNLSNPTEGTPFTINMTASSDTPFYEQARLFMVKMGDENYETVQITPTPTGMIHSDLTQTDSDGVSRTQHYYRIDGTNCQAGNDDPACTHLQTFENLEPGRYKFYCNMPIDQNNTGTACVGNPLCTFQDEGGRTNCNGFRECSANDSVEVTVNCAAQCGGDCGNADVGAPTVNITAPPANNNQMANQDSQLPISWNETTVPAVADNYDIRIFNRNYYSGANTNNYRTSFSQDEISGLNCSDPKVLCVNARVPNSYTYDPRLANRAAIGDRIMIAVRGRNTTCGDQEGLWATRLVNLRGDIPTQVRVLNPGETACTTGTSSPATFSQQNTYIAQSALYPNQQSFSPANNYSMNLRYTNTSWSGNYSMRLDVNEAGMDPTNTLVCASCSDDPNSNLCTPAGTDSRPAPTSSAAYFYLESLDLSHNPWFQWVNGNAFAGGNLSSEISSTCIDYGDCTQYMSIFSTTNRLHAGIPLSGLAAIDAGHGEHSMRRMPPGAQPGRYAVSQNFNEVARRDYDYYNSLFDFNGVANLGSNIQNYSIIGSPASGTYLREGGADIFHRNGDLTVYVNQAGRFWNVASNQKKVILVSGNLYINGLENQRSITVADGGYLAFVVGGDIVFNHNVGHRVTLSSNPQSAASSNVEGVFIGDRVVVATDPADAANNVQDLKFIGSGTFVGWDEIDLQRTFEDGDSGARFHNNVPTELFFYRPDFVLNAPRAMQETNLIWQERVQ